MWTVIFLIFLYIFSLVSTIKAACTGKGLFFPDFKRIDKVYFLGAKNVWNTWWGKLGYYIQLLFHLSVIILLLFMIIYGIIYIHSLAK